MENVFTVHNNFELVADPVYFPITIGNEHFIVTQLDRRSILDRRTWQLTRLISHSDPAAASAACLQLQNLCTIDPNALQQMVRQLMLAITFYRNAASVGDQVVPAIQPSFQFHYEKQTSTEDLPYYQRKNCGNGVKLEDSPTTVKHVHFVIDRSHWDKAINTDQLGEMFKSLGEPMECDPGEGSSGIQQKNTAAENAYDSMKYNKEQNRWFW